MNKKLKHVGIDIDSSMMVGNGALLCVFIIHSFNNKEVKPVIAHLPYDLSYLSGALLLDRWDQYDFVLLVLSI